jgi:hypothetical protein
MSTPEKIAQHHNESEEEKKSWPSGPWNQEANRVEWRDAETGLPCLIVRNHMGALCGYVGVPPGHPDHGKDYDDVDVEVHGGLTYAAPCSEGVICHVPQEGEPDDVWWLGFDCAHYLDIVPSMLRLRGQLKEVTGVDIAPPQATGYTVEETYRTLGYVEEEVRQLAKQLASHTPKTFKLTGGIESGSVEPA